MKFEKVTPFLLQQELDNALPALAQSLEISRQSELDQHDQVQSLINAMVYEILTLDTLERELDPSNVRDNLLTSPTDYQVQPILYTTPDQRKSVFSYTIPSVGGQHPELSGWVDEKYPTGLLSISLLATLIDRISAQADQAEIDRSSDQQKAITTGFNYFGISYFQLVAGSNGFESVAASKRVSSGVKTLSSVLTDAVPPLRVNGRDVERSTITTSFSVVEKPVQVLASVATVFIDGLRDGHNRILSQMFNRQELEAEKFRTSTASRIEAVGSKLKAYLDLKE